MTIEKMNGCVRLEMVRSTINLGMSVVWILGMIKLLLIELYGIIDKIKWLNCLREKTNPL